MTLQMKMKCTVPKTAPRYTGKMCPCFSARWNANARVCSRLLQLSVELFRFSDKISTVGYKL